MSVPSSSKIVVCGVARDVASDINREVSRIFKALSDFSSVEFIVVESLSKDSTVQKLKNLSARFSNFYFETIQHDENALKVRSVRLAEARNQALKIQQEKFSDANYVFVVDLDGVNRDLTREAIRSCFQHKHWDVITANQPRGYYDILALRHDFWNPHDWGEAYNELKSYMPDEVARYLAVFSKSIKLPKGGKLIPVKSAFGGGAIYSSSILSSASYSGFDSLGKEICEHVSLNRQIVEKGGRIFINPNFINVTHLGRSHSLKKRVTRWLEHS